MGTTVLIVGAGPAGLVLGCLLTGAGVDCTIVERERRAHVESRARAGFLAANTVRVLEENDLADGLRVNGHRHSTCAFRGDQVQFEIAYDRLFRARFTRCTPSRT